MIIRLLFAALGLCFGLACATSVRAATTYYVAPSGHDTNPGTSALPFLTLQRAANVVAAGDTVVVRAGVYQGAKFSTSGTAQAPITYAGDPGAIIQSAGAQNSNGDNLWIRDASFITITGFEVRNAPRAGIAVQAEPDAESHGVVLRKNFCHDNSRWGIFTAYAEGILIEYNETSFSGIEHGIYVSNSSDNPVLRHNLVHDNNASGIQINADPSLGGDGIISNAVIAYNTIWGNGAGGAAGINLASVVNSRITNNLLYDNHSTGIAGWDDDFDPAFGTHDNVFAFNTILQASNGRNATSFIHGSYNNVLKSNVILHPGTKAAVEVDTSSESGLASDYNIIIDRFSVNETFITAAQWRARNHDQHSVISNAGSVFFDATNHNYHLKPGSPAINAGTTVSGVADDLDGKRRSQGAGPDIGALEFRGADTAGIYVAGTGSWFLKNTNAPGAADMAFGFGAPSIYTPIVGDWDGDGVDTPGLYNSATGAFFLRNSSTPGPADVVFFFGAGGVGYVPVAGDWNGDGIDTVGVYSGVSGVFFLRNANASGGADLAFGYGPGGLGWKPLAGDWDGNGTDTVGVYDPANAAFFLKNSNGPGAADVVAIYGPPNATPVTGDWNADGIDTIGIYVPATGAWFLRNSNTPGAGDVVFIYGPPGAEPTDGDWDAL